VSEKKSWTVSEFLEEVKRLQEEIGCNGTRTGSHTYPSSVKIYVEGPDDFPDFEIDRLEPQMHLGCGCWTGIDIILKPREE
jgi:hypothetical protein